MALRIHLNKPHVERLAQFAVVWCIYLAFCLIAGWSLNPRLDEVIFVATLPLYVLVPYALFCFAAALIKLWSAHRYGWAVFLPGSIARKRIGARPR